MQRRRVGSSATHVATSRACSGTILETTLHYMARNGAPAKPWYDKVVATIAVRGWTKAELSDRSSVARTTIDNWERNPRKPQAKSVNAVADVLGIPREQALRLAGVIGGVEPADRSPPGEPATPDGLRAAIYDELPPDRARRVAELVEAELSGEPLPASRPSSGRPGKAG